MITDLLTTIGNIISLELGITASIIESNYRLLTFRIVCIYYDAAELHFIARIHTADMHLCLIEQTRRWISPVYGIISDLRGLNTKNHNHG